MSIKNNQFVADYSKPKMQIVITVYENSNTIEIKKIDGSDYIPKYHDVVGILEINKIRMINQQSDLNEKAYKKHLKTKKK